jgi:Brp/Blh family beta-carotene 15,15'-monooxygenase
MEHFHLKLKKSSLPDRQSLASFKIALWTKIATTVAVLVFLSTICLNYFFPNLDYRINLLITGLIFVGMPHGALDVYILKQILKTKQRFLIGLLIYIGVLIPIIILWPLYPTVCFLFFLGYSLIHFADSDMQDSASPAMIKAIEFLARVSLPFCLPFIFHQSETIEIVKWIQPQVNIMPFKSIFFFFGYVSLIFVAVYTVLRFLNSYKKLKDIELKSLEPLLISVLFILINPLLAFGIYFCFIHSIKHVVNVLQNIKINSPLTILPYWLIPLSGLPVLFYLYSANQDILGERVFQYIIIVLSSLALPHALLIRFGKSKLMLK